MLFVAALLPRALNLGAFATADEAKWVHRSAQFLAALLDGELGGTVVNLTPAVTTTWLGSLGMAVLHAQGGAGTGAPLGDWLHSLPEFRAEMDVLVATRWPMVLFGSLGVVGLYLLAQRLVGQRSAFAFGLLLAFDPHLISLSRLLGHDAPAGLLVGLSLLAFLVALQRRRCGGHLGWMATSGGLAGLAMLSKSPALFLAPFVGITSAILACFAGGPFGCVTRRGGLTAGLPRPGDLDRPVATSGHLVRRELGEKWGNTGRVFACGSPLPVPMPFGASTVLRAFRGVQGGRRGAGLLVWAVAAWLVFIAVWPAAWQKPLGMPYAVVYNAFLSATDTVEAEEEGYWQAPDLGSLYYPVNGLFKLSPLATVGLAGWAWSLLARRRGRKSGLSPVPRDVGSASECDRWVEWLLFAFAVLFTVFMTVGGKRSNRYLLPAWPALYLLAGLGLARLAGFLPALRLSRLAGLAIRLLVVMLLILPAAATYPYYFTYYNPLVGPLTAPYLVKIGWGEGLDTVGRWLQAQPDSLALRVGSYYASAVSPFFRGRISGVTAGQLDYVVLYVKQTQEGDPSPTFLRYFEAAPPLQSVRLAGIQLARVYAGPAMQPAMANEAAFDIGVLPKPLFFRPDRPYLPIGEPVVVEVLWLAEEDRFPAAPSSLTLQPAADLTGRPEQRSGRVWAAAEAPLQRRADGLVISRHALSLPPDLPRGSYGLLVDGRPLGTVEARQFRAPPVDFPVNADFGDQLRLMGALADPVVGTGSTLRLVWQAAPRAWADYTVFLHLLDTHGERVAGVDVQPPAPATEWARGEVVVIAYGPGGQPLPIPPDLPAGAYQLAVGLYHPTTGERLPVRGVPRDGASLGDHVLLPLSVATVGADEN